MKRPQILIVAICLIYASHGIDLQEVEDRTLRQFPHRDIQSALDRIRVKIPPMIYRKPTASVTLDPITVTDIVLHQTDPQKVTFDPENNKVSFELSILFDMSMEFNWDALILTSPLMGTGNSSLSSTSATYTLTFGSDWKSVTPSLQCSWYIHSVYAEGGFTPTEQLIPIVKAVLEKELNDTFLVEINDILRKYIGPWYTDYYGDRLILVEYPFLNFTAPLFRKFIDFQLGDSDNHTLSVSYDLDMPSSSHRLRGRKYYSWPKIELGSGAGAAGADPMAPPNIEKQFFISHSVVIKIMNEVVPLIPKDIKLTEGDIGDWVDFKLDFVSFQKVIPDILLKNQNEGLTLEMKMSGEENLVIFYLPDGRLSLENIQLDLAFSSKTYPTLLNAKVALVVYIYPYTNQVHDVIRYNMKIQDVHFALKENPVSEHTVFKLGLNEFMGELFNFHLIPNYGHMLLGAGIDFKDKLVPANANIQFQVDQAGTYIQVLD